MEWVQLIGLLCIIALFFLDKFLWSKKRFSSMIATINSKNALIDLVKEKGGNIHDITKELDARRKLFKEKQEELDGVKKELSKKVVTDAIKNIQYNELKKQCIKYDCYINLYTKMDVLLGIDKERNKRINMLNNDVDYHELIKDAVDAVVDEEYSKNN